MLPKLRPPHALDDSLRRVSLRQHSGTLAQTTVDSGTAVVSCAKGSGIGAWSRSYRRAGTFKLPMTRGPETCSVVAAVGGSGAWSSRFSTVKHGGYASGWLEAARAASASGRSIARR